MERFTRLGKTCRWEIGMPGIQRQDGQETKWTSQWTWKGVSEKGGHSSTAWETPQRPWKRWQKILICKRHSYTKDRTLNMDWKSIAGLAWTSRVSCSEMKGVQRESNNPNSQTFTFKLSEPYIEFHNQSPIKIYSNKGKDKSQLPLNNLILKYSV